MNVVAQMRALPVIDAEFAVHLSFAIRSALAAEITIVTGHSEPERHYSTAGNKYQERKCQAWRKIVIDAPRAREDTRLAAKPPSVLCRTCNFDRT